MKPFHSSESPLPRNRHRSPRNRPAFALVSVLMVVTLLVVTVLAYFLRATSDRKMARVYADGVEARTLSESAVNFVMAQIRDGTAGFERDATSGELQASDRLAWASQPGMIRTWDESGNDYRHYKLYSDDNMVISAQHALALQADSDEAAGGGVQGWGGVYERNGADYPYGALWVDLNAPVRRENASLAYPVVTPPATLDSANGVPVDDPDTEDQEGVMGFEINSPPAFSGSDPSPVNNPAPMPVRWLYVLENGTVTPATGSQGEVTVDGATEDNRIIGRIAFWTDDETSKLNLNTASEGLFWDYPRATGGSMVEMGKFQPTGNEHQRHGGHPATTSLSAVFPGFAERTADVYALFPRYTFGGSLQAYANLGGTSPLSLSGDLVLDPIGRKQSATFGSGGIGHPSILDYNKDRLFATVDEFFFRAPTGGESERVAIDTDLIGLSTAVGSPGAFGQFLEASRFFLTTSSRAPETSIFNTPKISLWPLHTNDTLRDPYEQIIEFCTTLKAEPYYFQRENPYSVTDDYQTILRNQQLFDYLKDLAGETVPGFGGTISGKANFDSDQLFVTIFDYIRALPNPYGIGFFADSDAKGKNPARFTKGYSIPRGIFQGNPGFVYPIEIDGMRGFGDARFITKFGFHLACEEISYSDADEEEFDTPLGDADPSTPQLESPARPHIMTFTLRALPILESYTPTRTYGPPDRGIAMRLKAIEGFPLRANEVVSRTFKDGTNDVEVKFDLTGKLTVPQIDADADSLAEALNDVVGEIWKSLGGPSGFDLAGDIIHPVGSFLADGKLRGKAKTIRVRFMVPHEIWETSGKYGDPAKTEYKPGDLKYTYAAQQGKFRPVFPEFDKMYKTGTAKGNIVSIPTNGSATAIPGFFLEIGAGRVEVELLGLDEKGNVDASAVLHTAEFRFPGYGYVNPEADDDPPSTGEPIPPEEELPDDYIPGGGVPFVPPGSKYTNVSMYGVPVPYPNRILYATYAPGDPMAKTPAPQAGGGNTVYKIETQDKGGTGFKAGWTYRYASDLFQAATGAEGDVTFHAEPRSNSRSYGDWRLLVFKESLNSREWAYPDRDIRKWKTERAKPTEVTAYMMWHSLAHDVANDTFWRERGKLTPEMEFIKNAGPVGGLASVSPSDGALNRNGDPGDWDNGMGRDSDGAWINGPESGGLGQLKLASGGSWRLGTRDSYFASWQTSVDGSSPASGGIDNATNFALSYSPNRQIYSAFQFGSLPRGPDRPWETVLFCPNPASGEDHPAYNDTPPDHLLADLFWMPVVDPYAISEPFSTAGKVNLNSAIAPFGYITRNTALHGVFKGAKITAIDGRKIRTRGAGNPQRQAWKITDSTVSQGGSVDAANVAAWEAVNFFYDIHLDETLKAVSKRFNDGEIYKSATEIADVFLYPKSQTGNSALVSHSDTSSSAILNWWNSGSGADNRRFSGDNTRESPYAHLHPRLTTKSNTFRVHYTVQALKQGRRSDSADYAIWRENSDQVVGEFRGSTLLERYIDPNDPALPDFATISLNSAEAVLDSYYRFRVLETKRFQP